MGSKATKTKRVDEWHPEWCSTCSEETHFGTQQTVPLTMEAPREGRNFTGRKAWYPAILDARLYMDTEGCEPFVAVCISDSPQFKLTMAEASELEQALRRLQIDYGVSLTSMPKEIWAAGCAAVVGEL